MALKLFNRIKKFYRIIVFLTPHKQIWLGVFVLSMVISLLDLANPLFLKFLIDDVLVSRDYGLLKLLMIFFIGVQILAVTFTNLYNYFYKKLELFITYDVRNKLFGHLERLDLDFFYKQKMGDLLVRLESDVSGIQEFISYIYNNFLLYSLQIIFAFCISLTLNWKITLLSLLGFPIYAIFEYYFAKKMVAIFSKIRKNWSYLINFFQEKLSGIFLIKIFNQQQQELAQEKAVARKLIKSELRGVRVTNLAQSTISLITFGILLFVLWYGGWLVTKDAMTIGALIALYSYMSGLFDPIEGLVNLYADAKVSLVYVDRVFELLETKPKVQEVAGAYRLPKVRGLIEFKDVSFSYQADEILLKQVNFTIQPGEVVGIKGGNGSGKTTIAKLLLRLYDPQQGQILIDGHDVRGVKLNSLYDQVGYISSELIIFNSSIRDNISYGKARATFKQVVTAAKAAKVHDFIMSLPHGYKTILGERGLAISAGERQKIALARLFLRQSQIIILDEATSSIDEQTRLQIINDLIKEANNRVIIIISHQIDILACVNNVLSIKAGKVTVSNKRKCARN